MNSRNSVNRDILNDYISHLMRDVLLARQASIDFDRYIRFREIILYEINFHPEMSAEALWQKCNNAYDHVQGHPASIVGIFIN